MEAQIQQRLPREMEHPGEKNSGIMEVRHTFPSGVTDVIALGMPEEQPASAAATLLSHRETKLSNSSNSSSSCVSGAAQGGAGAPIPGDVQGRRHSLLCSLLSPDKTKVLWKRKAALGSSTGVFMLSSLTGTRITDKN